MHGIEMPYSQEFYPLGFPARITSNSPLALKAAQESWGVFPLRFDRRPVEFSVLVAGEESRTHSADAAYWGHGHLMTVSADAANCAVCDLDRGVGFCVVTPATIADSGYFRYYFLEGVVLSAIERLYMVSLHAACVALEGRGILLCGDSGSGKTCLTYACARAGFTYISDDAISMVRGRRDRTVLGLFHQIRFRPEAAALFPELEGLPQFITESGQPSVQVNPADFAGIVTAPSCTVEHVVFLNRSHNGPAECRHISTDEALRRLVGERAISALPPRPDDIAAMRALLVPSTYELCYSDLSSGVNELENLLKGVAV
jgi:hypothetical protein